MEGVPAGGGTGWVLGSLPTFCDHPIPAPAMEESPVGGWSQGEEGKSSPGLAQG